MRHFKVNLFAMACIIIAGIFFITSCEKQSKETTSQTPPKKEEKTTEQPKQEIKEEKPPLTFQEFAQNFIRDSKISEENFLKYCDDLVNGKDPADAYKTFKACSKLYPNIKEGSITFVKRDVSLDSGDPTKHVYRFIFKKIKEGDWKLTKVTYKYDLDESRLPKYY